MVKKILNMSVSTIEKTSWHDNLELDILNMDIIVLFTSLTYFKFRKKTVKGNPCWTIPSCSFTQLVWEKVKKQFTTPKRMKISSSLLSATIIFGYSAFQPVVSQQYYYSKGSKGYYPSPSNPSPSPPGGPSPDATCLGTLGSSCRQCNNQSESWIANCNLRVRLY